MEESGITVSDNSEVSICAGSGTWYSSIGAVIPVAMVLSPTINVFQRRDLRDVILSITGKHSPFRAFPVRI